MSGLKSVQAGEAGSGSPPACFFYRWPAFIVGIFLLAALVFFAPKLENLPHLGPQITALRESEVETGAFFYTDVEKISGIEYRLLHLRDYFPQGNTAQSNYPEKEINQR